MSEHADLPVVRATRAALADADSVAAVGARVLESVGDMLGWLVGALWMPDASGTLEAVATWRARVHKATGFEATTRRTRLAPGRGLPGRVWATGEALWLRDVVGDPNFPRVDAARTEGLHGAVAFPVTHEGRALGVIEFFTDTFRNQRPVLDAVAGEVGREVGAALARVGATPRQ